jgi:hypothetical protein
VIGAGKRMHQVATRVDEETLDEIDRYQRELEASERRPLSRSLVILDLLVSFAAKRREEAARRREEAPSRARVDQAGT